MKKMIFTALVLATAFTGVKAQDNDDSQKNREKFRTEMISKQAEQLAEDMKLDDSKVTEFKTLFTEYKTKEMELKFADKKESKARGKQNKAKREEMTDAKADSVMNANFEKQEKELSLQKEYYAKFKEMLGAANAFKIFSQRPQFGPGMGGGPQMRNRGGNDGGFGGDFGGGRPGGGDF